MWIGTWCGLLAEVWMRQDVQGFSCLMELIGSTLWPSAVF